MGYRAGVENLLNVQRRYVQLEKKQIKYLEEWRSPFLGDVKVSCFLLQIQTQCLSDFFFIISHVYGYYYRVIMPV